MKKYEPNDRLRDARNLRHLSQGKLGEYIGATARLIGQWERGDAQPGEVFRKRLSEFFEMTPEALGLPDPSPSAVIDPLIPLPPHVPLVGRESDIEGVRLRLLASVSVTLTAINGLPGVGKTALAVALAHDSKIRAYFREGILWAGLGPHPNISAVLNRWGRLLDITSSEQEPLRDDASWAKAIHSALGERRVLLVIDDVWNVEDALVLKVGGPNCAHLVTTRFPNIASHISINAAVVIKELDTDHSMDLLRLLAPGVVESDQGALDLVQAVGGLPLALTLMGNYLRKQTYSGGGQPRRISAAVQRLSDARERLNISEPGEPVARNPSLAADTALSLQSVIAVTDQQLAPETRAALYALSVFPAKPNSFSELAAQAIANCSPDTLDTLVDTGLLESRGTDRYSLHQTICDYASTHLTDEDAFKRLISYSLAYAEQHARDYENLERESSTLLAALETANTRGWGRELVQGACILAPFLLVRGVYPLAERHMNNALNAAREQRDARGITYALLYLGKIAQEQGDYTRAEASFQQGLTLARRDMDRERMSALLSELGAQAWKQGAYAQAEQYLQEGLRFARQGNYYEHLISLLKTLGTLAASRGDYNTSNSYLLEALDIARQYGDRAKVCNLLLNLGTNKGNLGDYQQAIAYLQEGLAIARQVGHREYSSILLLNMGTLAYGREDYEAAEQYLQEGLTLVRQIGHREWTSIFLINIAEMLRRRGNYPRAEMYLRDGKELAQELGNPRIIAAALLEEGNLHLHREEVTAADRTFRETLNIIPDGDREMLALARYGLARVAAARHDYTEARNLGEASTATLEAMGHRKAPEVRKWLDAQHKVKGLVE
jgi:tetratricopeptide (TPR) repeat protein/transcriptional regulator with XRE-family HTH domain